MTTEAASAHDGHQHQTKFTARVSDETFTFQEIEFDDRKVTGGQIANAVGAHPIDEFVVLQQLDNLEIETLRPTELADLSKQVRFFVICGDGTERFTVDGLSLEWPRVEISGLDIKRLVGRENDDIELVLERSDAPDRVIEDDDTVRIGAKGVERFKTRPPKGGVLIFVDGEEYEAPRRKMTPNEIITEAAGKDPASHYLVQITKEGRISYEGKGNEPIKLKKGMRFQVISTGPTPVSDPNVSPGLIAFIQGLQALGYEPTALKGAANHVIFDYTVESGKFRGTKVRHGLVIPSDFPMTPPSGPYVSPEIHPIQPQSGPHPLFGVHKDQARIFDATAGGAWQYWSRPFPDWPGSKRNVRAYLSHIWKLWDSQ